MLSDLVPLIWILALMAYIDKHCNLIVQELHMFFLTLYVMNVVPCVRNSNFVKKAVIES